MKTQTRIIVFVTCMLVSMVLLNLGAVAFTSSVGTGPITASIGLVGLLIFWLPGIAGLYFLQPVFKRSDAVENWLLSIASGVGVFFILAATESFWFVPVWKILRAGSR